MNMSPEEQLTQLRRAIHDSNEQAWQDIYSQYHRLILGWISTYDTHKQLSQEDYADLVQETLVRFFRATTVGTAEKSFDDIAGVYVYLKQCAHSALCDTLRYLQRHVYQEETREAVERRMLLADPATLMGEADAFQALWHLVQHELHTEQERLVATHCWLADIAPRELQRRYPALFPSVKEVYRHRRLLQRRIQYRLASRPSEQDADVPAHHLCRQSPSNGNLENTDTRRPLTPDAACLTLLPDQASDVREHREPQHETYHQQVSYCGKARCRRCRERVGHGPYWYAYSYSNGQTIRHYIGKTLPEDVMQEFVAQP